MTDENKCRLLYYVKTQALHPKSVPNRSMTSTQPIECRIGHSPASSLQPSLPGNCEKRKITIHEVRWHYDDMITGYYFATHIHIFIINASASMQPMNSES